MPIYSYACAACGPFSAMRPLAEYRAPAPCPACGSASDRVLTAPVGLARSQRRAGADDASGGYGRLAHAAGCACCPAPRVLSKK
jgi:putative FmdB family regulatory protein